MDIPRQHGGMTVSGQPDSPARSEIIVRDYAESDYGACRSLWAELTEYHRVIYGDPSIGDDDPGAGFDDYLASSHRLGSWVAGSGGMSGYPEPACTVSTSTTRTFLRSAERRGCRAHVVRTT